MITVQVGARILVATKPVDFRRGADSLAALAREELQRDPFSGVIIVFRSKVSGLSAPPSAPSADRRMSCPLSRAGWTRVGH
jgi:transposase